MTRIKPVYLIAAAGFVLAVGAAWALNRQQPPEKPLFNPISNPFPDGLYANGMVESRQSQGIDVALNPEVSGKVTQVLVKEGDIVHAGQPILRMDDSIQRATTAQLDAAAAAASGMLAELKAQPRREVLAVAEAQADNAAATLKNAADARAKQEQAYSLDPRSVSKDQLDTARNTEAIAATAYKAARRNADLVKAGAWKYDIDNQAAQAQAAAGAAQSAHATLDKFTLRAPSDGVVMALAATIGSWIQPAGVYDPRTQATLPVITFGTPQNSLQVRAYVDEILVPSLPRGAMRAVMRQRGSSRNIPITFDHVQPYVSPKVSLSDQRQERVDIRVLPVIFTFEKPKDLAIYPGQMVDIYIGGAQKSGGAR